MLNRLFDQFPQHGLIDVFELFDIQARLAGFVLA